MAVKLIQFSALLLLITVSGCRGVSLSHLDHALLTQSKASNGNSPSTVGKPHLIESPGDDSGRESRQKVQKVDRDAVGIIVHALNSSSPVMTKTRLRELKAGWARIDVPWMAIDPNSPIHEESLGIEVDPWTTGYDANRIYNFDRPKLNETINNLTAMGVQIYGSINYVPYGHRAEIFEGVNCNVDSCPAFEKLVEATVRNFGAKIQVYGIFNEANDNSTDNPTRQTDPRTGQIACDDSPRRSIGVKPCVHGWPSTFDRYVSLLIIGCRTIHRVGSEMGVRLKCAGPEIGSSDDPNRDRDAVLSALETARSKGVDIDIVSTHAYADGPDSATRLNIIRTGMASAGFYQPLWLTEAGYPQSIKADMFEVQEKDMVSKLQLAKRGIADKVFYYELLDYNYFYGITNEDACLSKRPAFNAFQHMVEGTYLACASGSCSDDSGNCTAEACQQASSSCNVSALDPLPSPTPSPTPTATPTPDPKLSPAPAQPGTQPMPPGAPGVPGNPIVPGPSVSPVPRVSPSPKAPRTPGQLRPEQTPNENEFINTL